MASTMRGSPGEELDARGGATPVEALDMKSLRKELKKLRRGGGALAVHVKKARRELARARKRQKEAEQLFRDNKASVAVLSKRLGCSAEGLPEIDEWRELAREHGLREKELRKQIADEKVKHADFLEELRAELERGGRPETAKSHEAAESQERRRSADERCGQIQAVRDYINGDLEGITLEELRELVQPRPAGTGAAVAAPGVSTEPIPSAEAYYGFVEAALEELRERHQLSLRDLVQLSNAVIGRKDAHLKALAYNVLGRGLEDMKLCTPAERNALRELLKDVESLCAWRLAGGGKAD
eukprot:CAMPEP_0179258444 /NCGR_PEP_ID=MMETSP0797-20121207/25317_1 /TAXON_ID=47934 /ORGANISM="Dinophysis acuminata, Strain DAEP01" /LENGTH=298 /DNA_ID=CAMNT_0020966473 /DNA_START=1 /DNA_END=897 /DNA_ORIENTATION=-